jgi:hypothetical protein
VRTVTLLQLETDARLFADERPGGANSFINTIEIRRLINYALAELYELFVRAGGHEYYETIDLTKATAVNSATVTPPTDMLTLLSLYLDWGRTSGVGTPSKQLERVDALPHIDDRRELVAHGVWSRDSGKAFRIRGARTNLVTTKVIEFFPTPTRITYLELRYVPTFVDLVNDTDVFDGVDGWEKMVALRVAMEMQAIRRVSTSETRNLYQEEKARIEMLADKQAGAHPIRVRDVRYSGEGLLGRRRLGGVPYGST